VRHAVPRLIYPCAACRAPTDLPPCGVAAPGGILHYVLRQLAEQKEPAAVGGLFPDSEHVGARHAVPRPDPPPCGVAAPGGILHYVLRQLAEQEEPAAVGGLFPDSEHVGARHAVPRPDPPPCGMPCPD